MKNETKEGSNETEELCCPDKNACSIECAPKKKDKKIKCDCGGCCQ